MYDACLAAAELLWPHDLDDVEDRTRVIAAKAVLPANAPTEVGRGPRQGVGDSLRLACGEWSFFAAAFDPLKSRLHRPAPGL